MPRDTECRRLDSLAIRQYLRTVGHNVLGFAEGYYRHLGGRGKAKQVYGKCVKIVLLRRFMIAAQR